MGLNQVESNPESMMPGTLASLSSTGIHLFFFQVLRVNIRGLSLDTWLWEEFHLPRSQDSPFESKLDLFTVYTSPNQENLNLMCADTHTRTAWNKQHSEDHRVA